METLHKASEHVIHHHDLYRRLMVLMFGVVAVMFVAHWLEVMFATMNLLHFLELDDLAAKVGL